MDSCIKHSLVRALVNTQDKIQRFLWNRELKDFWSHFSFHILTYLNKTKQELSPIKFWCGNKAEYTSLSVKLIKRLLPF